jgi:hypothetical protein
MADAIGTFSLQHTGNTYSKTADGCLVTNAHFEGTATGYGTGFGTLGVTQKLSEASATSGTCTWAGQTFQDDGTTLGGFGDGTWEQKSGESNWTVDMTIDGSNGDRVRMVGVLDLATRSFKGDMFDAS